MDQLGPVGTREHRVWKVRLDQGEGQDTLETKGMLDSLGFRVLLDLKGLWVLLVMVVSRDLVAKMAPRETRVTRERRAWLDQRELVVSMATKVLMDHQGSLEIVVLMEREELVVYLE